MTGPRGETPRQAVQHLVAARGQSWVVDCCAAVLDAGEVDVDLLVGLSGRHAELVLSGREGGVEGYWPRVWVLRAFLYAWDERAASSVVAALADESWRVREMALKVIRRRRLTGSLPAVTTLLLDPVERVREAATQALDAI